jgi:hypothetical protein
VKQFRSGARTGDICQCSADIWSYHRTRWYKPGEVIPDAAEDTTWFWELVCEHGHVQPAPEKLVQMSLLEMM